MPDILIRGMEMPTGELNYREIQVWSDGTVCVRKGLAGSMQQTDAKAIKLPPHVDLISRDDLLYTMRCHLALYDSCPEDLSLADKTRRDEIQNAIADIFNAPVVVPAERRE